jgi:periplasmic protein CpxP/Spy
MNFNRVKMMAATMVVLMAGAMAMGQTVTPVAYGYGHGRGHGMRGGSMIGFMIHRLDLTDAQRAQIKQIMSQERPAMKPMMQQMAQSRQQMLQLELSGTFDEAAARNLATQQSQTMADMIVQRAKVESQVIAVLTPDQKTKLNQMITAHEQRMQQRMQQRQSQQAPPADTQNQ